MDDPLSALDPEVALKVFEECIIGFLKDRTRVLVTNQLQCLSQCDSIVALGRGGRVIEQGTFDDLMSVENGEVQRLLRDLEESAKKNSEEGDGLQTKKLEGSTNGHDLENARSSEPKTAKADPERDGKGLVTQEEREVGSVKMDVYKKYLLAGGGFLRFALVFLFFVLSTTVNLVRDVWVALWTSDSDYSEHAKEFYLGGYTGFAMLVGVFTFFRSFGLASFGVRASKELHQNLLSSVFRAPMSFFDTTPTGRILSRFSKDMYTIDAELSNFIDFVLFMVLSVLVSVATIAFSTPLFLVALLPLGILYFKILNYFRAVSRETKRLESISRSPVYSHFSETLGGLSTIRAYGENATFISDFESKLDVSTQAGYCIKAGDRWLSVRLELIGASIAGVAAVFSTNVVLSNGMSSVSASSSYASLAGLSLTYAIQITGMLQWVVRSFAQVEAAMNSAERVLYYSENIAKEAAVETSQLQKDADSDAFMNVATRAVAACSGMTVDTPEDWPLTGEMKISNLRMRYRTASPLVLKGLNLFISGGERVGVVGRTGSGKSSLLLCLLRIVEPELDESAEKYIAPITIDGVDVLRIGLKALRSAIGIIPQNPVLFSGTIRSNMDPFDEYTDEKIWVALEKCGMMQAVSGMPDGLLSPVAEYGENLSQGQRQLLCLGRALLKQCRILLLDEATSSVDFETDREIQRTLREAFQGSTVLTIAHRVNTIMDSDKILVMKDGVAAEFGPPSELLQDENSLFSDIYRHSRAESDA